MPAKKKPTVRRDKSGALGKAELNEFKALLNERMGQIKKAVDKMGTDALSHSGAEASGALSTMPLHMADVGSDAFEQDMTLGRLEVESREMEEIGRALTRIDAGSYGLCENCRKPIPKGRLRAIPYARLCIECKEKEEAPH